ncbi:triose-phosphate isomerase [Halorubrum gandharaense]
MSLPTPCFLCSFKTYPGTAGRDGVSLARELAGAASDAGVPAAIAPQIPDLRLFAEAVDVPLIAQAADAAAAGEGTGDVLVETLATAGADALFVNHPEREASLSETRELIRRCDDVGLDAVVCVRSVAEARAVTEFGADWVLFERPEDVASGEPLVAEEPARVREAVDAVASVNSTTRIAVGGGVAEPSHVAAARECGVDGVGAASAVVTAENPAETLRGLLDAF